MRDENQNFKISVVTICLNNKDGLKKTINSVIFQDYDNLELIIVDGGSTDGSKELLEEFNDSISYWVSEKDNGIYSAQNKGILYSTGDYILFLNSGDYLVDSQVVSDVVDEISGESVVYGDLLIDYGDHQEKGISPNQITPRFMIKSTLWHPVSFIKSDLFRKYGLYDESFKIVGDYDFFLKVLIQGRESYKHLSRQVACFNTMGIGSSEKWFSLHEEERLISQKKYFSERNILDLKSDPPQGWRYFVSFLMNGVYLLYRKVVKK
ncbi:MAG: glycosyltransferase [Bdellovibrionales bacterium]|nr:glycosyltransferase [Bdellovibrionales bacterium]